MKVRVNLLDFLGVYSGELVGKEYFNLHPSVRIERFLDKYGLDSKDLDEMKLAVAAGNFRIRRQDGESCGSEP